VNFDLLYEKSEPKQLKKNFVDSIESQLTRLWRSILKSNIENAKLVNYDLNYVTINKTIDPAVLILSYTLKLDKRISNDNATVTKILEIINSTILTPNSLIYKNLTTGFTASVSFILPDFEISCNSF